MMMNNGVLSNLMSSNSCEVSASSSSNGSRSNNNSNSNNKDNSNVESGTRSHQPFASATQALAPPKKRGHPDAEVIALSPKSLLATNRFICEICSKGFQRDQNLQLHRRGHNLPWKLKQRSSKDVVKKKVYVCPEPTCIHHDLSRALGDLTGIKKHFCRKHGEKKWKCEKCTKRYAVHSDWKAHSKICGTREYRCDCGTLFSRRDSFITHRAFCDALAQENSSSSTLFSPKNLLSSPINSLQHLSTPYNLHPHAFSIKTEPENLHHHLFNPTQQELLLPSTSIFDPSLISQTNPNPTLFQSSVTASSAPPHMSATALLQRADQMGVTMRKPSAISPSPLMPPRHASSGDHHDVSESTTTVAGSTGMVSSSCGEDRFMAGPGGSFFPLLGLETFWNEAAALASTTATAANNTVISLAAADEVRLPHWGMDQGTKDSGVPSTPHNRHLDHNQIMVMMNARNTVPSSKARLPGSYLSSSFNNNESIMMRGIMNTLEEDNHFNSDLMEKEMESHSLIRRSDQGMTRDFLGLRAFSSVPGDLVKVPRFDPMNSSSSSSSNYNYSNNKYGQQNKDQYQSLWQNN
ncbi:protein indeterminate-domain 7-like isoform X2 [Punica granatum]|uniref:Protein indeterminate-domain 7-like isoform X2 n=1 Tax=Punica granatum TaxID=22663 RepID=A0A6P8C1H6_PUNGR|nr:protein indeterminate-domain 7-like isoform X2 [Punica granatum]